MQVGEQKKEKRNVMLLTTSSEVGDEVLVELRGLKDVFSAKKIEL